MIKIIKISINKIIKNMFEGLMFCVFFHLTI